MTWQLAGTERKVWERNAFGCIEGFQVSASNSKREDLHRDPLFFSTTVSPQGVHGIFAPAALVPHFFWVFVDQVQRNKIVALRLLLFFSHAIMLLLFGYHPQVERNVRESN